MLQCTCLCPTQDGGANQVERRGAKTAQLLGGYRYFELKREPHKALYEDLHERLMPSSMFRDYRQALPRFTPLRDRDIKGYLTQ